MAAIKIKQGEDWVKLPNVGIQEGIADAPVDDKQYVRSNGEWVEVEESSKAYIVDYLDDTADSGTFTQEQFNGLSEAIMNDTPVYAVFYKNTENKTGQFIPATCTHYGADYIFLRTFPIDTDSHIIRLYLLDNTELTWTVEDLNLVDKDYFRGNCLSLSNTTAFTPDSDYEPATKKYVDDNVYTLPAASSDTLGGIQTGYLKASETEFPVQLDSYNNAYVIIPTVGSAAGLMTVADWEKLSILRSYTTATTVASLSTEYESIFVTLSANASLSMANTGSSYDGRSVTAYVYTAAAHTITIPTTGNYVSMCGSSFTTTAGGWVEFNLTCINGIWHIAKLEQE